MIHILYFSSFHLTVKGGELQGSLLGQYGFTGNPRCKGHKTATIAG